MKARATWAPSNDPQTTSPKGVQGRGRDGGQSVNRDWSSDVCSSDLVPLFMLSGFLMGYGISIIYAICQAIVVTSSPAHRYG
ncbi:MAG: hypothetical protein IKQ93_08115, partial [Candidatus Methanomethylophilaceae archaeon]|nr:hypothetical protein [Candidatus Methanomethylophilaceae archaeon]